jgi:hypothetical protein
MTGLSIAPYCISMFPCTAFWGSRSNGTKNVKVVQEVLYIGLKIEKLSYGATCDISYYESASNNALASWRSAVSNPSVNQP